MSRAVGGTVIVLAGVLAYFAIMHSRASREVAARNEAKATLAQQLETTARQASARLAGFNARANWDLPEEQFRRAFTQDVVVATGAGSGERLLCFGTVKDVLPAGNGRRTIVLSSLLGRLEHELVVTCGAELFGPLYEAVREDNLALAVVVTVNEVVPRETDEGRSYRIEGECLGFAIVGSVSDVESWWPWTNSGFQAP